MESYRHLRLDDRRTVFRLIESGRPVREISTHLHRHPSTIYRELRRNRHHDAHPPFRGYFPMAAQDQAASRRARGAKVARPAASSLYCRSVGGGLVAGADSGLCPAPPFCWPVDMPRDDLPICLWRRRPPTRALAVFALCAAIATPALCAQAARRAYTGGQHDQPTAT